MTNITGVFFGISEINRVARQFFFWESEKQKIIIKISLTRDTYPDQAASYLLLFWQHFLVMHIPVLSCETNNFIHEYKFIRLYNIVVKTAIKPKN